VQVWVCLTVECDWVSSCTVMLSLLGCVAGLVWHVEAEAVRCVDSSLLLRLLEDAAGCVAARFQDCYGMQLAVWQTEPSHSLLQLRLPLGATALVWPLCFGSWLQSRRVPLALPLHVSAAWCCGRCQHNQLCFLRVCRHSCLRVCDVACVWLCVCTSGLLYCSCSAALRCLHGGTTQVRTLATFAFA
jgi:hypothetical protein